MEETNEVLDKNQIHESLSNTSVELHYMFWNVPREVQVKRPAPDEWSPLEILIHLRQAGEVYASRVKRIVAAEDEDDIPFMHNFDENRQMSYVDLEEETVKYNIGQFMQARSKLLNQISFLEPEEWEKLKCEHEVDGILNLKQLLTPLVKREQKYMSLLKELIRL